MEVTSGQQKPEDEAQMSHYVVDKVRANRAGIKNLFQGPDGSSIWGGRAGGRTMSAQGSTGKVPSHDDNSGTNYEP